MQKEAGTRKGISLFSNLVHSAARLGSVSFGGRFGQHGNLEPWPSDSWIRTPQLNVHALRWDSTTPRAQSTAIPVSAESMTVSGKTTAALDGTAPLSGEPTTGPGGSDVPHLVLLHGLGSNPWVWGEVGALLSGNWPILAPAMPGHGKTRYEGPYDTPTIAQRIAETIDAVTLGPVYLVGHSWGGKVASVVAALLGTRCKSLVLADPAPPKGMNPVVQRFPTLATAVFEPERGPFGDHVALKRSLRKLLYLNRWGALEQRIALESFRQESDGCWHAVLPDGAFKEILHNCLYEDTSMFLDQIRCPVLLIRPTYSLSFLPGELAELRGRPYHLTEQRIQGDHDFNVTNPADMAQILSDWLKTGQLG